MDKKILQSLVSSFEWSGTLKAVATYESGRPVWSAAGYAEPKADVDLHEFVLKVIGSFDEGYWAEDEAELNEVVDRIVVKEISDALGEVDKFTHGVMASFCSSFDTIQQSWSLLDKWNSSLHVLETERFYLVIAMINAE